MTLSMTAVFVGIDGNIGGLWKSSIRDAITLVDAVAVILGPESNNTKSLMMLRAGWDLGAGNTELGHEARLESDTG
jgi:hypothetical protein